MVNKEKRNIPNGWSVINLDTVTEHISRGKSPKYVEKSDFKVINQKCIYWNRLRLGNIKYVDEATKDKWSDKLFVRNGDLLLNSTGTGTIGRANVFTSKENNFVVDSHVTIVRTDDSLLMPNYLKNYIEYSPNQQQLAALCFTGSTNQVELSKTELLKYPIMLPPVSEQQKIASILNSVDTTIEKTEQIIEQTEKVKKGLMQQLLTKGIGHTKFKHTEIGEIPEEWEVKTMEEICKKIFVGIATSTTGSYTTKGVPIIRNQNIHEDYLSATDLLQITSEFSEKNKNKKLIQGDILTVRTGYPGISCVVPQQMDGAHTFTTLVSRPNKEQVDSHYLSRYINSETGKKFVIGGKAGGAQQNLNVAIMKNLPVALPQIEEQREIVKIINSIDYKLVTEKEKYSKLQTIKKSLMQVLLTGKVRVKVDE
ncbi:restriction endonuclease subunit S [Alkalihalophilus marmarensis]|uniref:restriction endonuclease subunit S n=1 Tax=Alkalihalophilus marmarensis TaxID=521377 RepID=UPI0020417FEE|nr:restriction endonuclease subunit S [Alkalihalophilus marmarensis]MCM3491164.1 restriction endonuclease subunit S [Alkalihalophilus marmarensis]